LQTSATLDGNELVVNGQKIWTSNAQWADYQELLVRTDPDVPKHEGISWVICDMQSVGIDVRPITTIDGQQTFCEVFYTDVRIPVTNVVGGLNQGWKVAMSTLSIERGPSVLRERIEVIPFVERLIEEAARRGIGLDSALGEQLALVRARAAAVQAMAYAIVSRAGSGRPSGPEGSLIKVYGSELFQQVTTLAIEILGPDALEMDDLVERWLRSLAYSIQGGTTDIQRNIIGERLLGLPR
jgi:alkylation response protein AidB-like acyl-CoA dehydrogenase